MLYLDLFGNSIELTEERWFHIIKEHPEVKNHKDNIREVLSDPDYIKKSSRDEKLILYYKWYGDIFSGKYFLAVVKKGLRSFVLTCYITDMVKKGETLWEKK